MVAVSAARADVPVGLYALRNHPAVANAPPAYGARFDELYNATAAHDNFTLDFEHPSSAMFMTVTETTIRIFGQSFGGRDVGDAYADDVYRGVYSLDFLYTVGVGLIPWDDDRWVDAPSASNFGTITGPGMLGTRNLTDERSVHYSFRVGDENDDMGLEGVPGIAGWGWMSYVVPDGPPVHVAESDWRFRATMIPGPGAGALAAIAIVLAPGARRRRR